MQRLGPGGSNALRWIDCAGSIALDRLRWIDSVGAVGMGGL